MRERLKNFLTPERSTSIADVFGCLLIVVGIGLIAGIGASFVTAGIATLVLSYLVA